MKRILTLCTVLIAGIFGASSKSQAQTLFSDNFDSYSAPSTVTATGIANGYNFLFSGASGPTDFKAIFGFDYSKITLPFTIPPAPNSGGTTKGLFLTANKDATAAICSVNLYPTNLNLTGDYVLKFDLWLNYTNAGNSTEHAFFGINHSGTFANRPNTAGSDGVFIAMDSDGAQGTASTTARDYGFYVGRGSAGTPLQLTNNPPTTFLYSATTNFDNLEPFFQTLFPSKTGISVANGGATPAGSAGLGWVSVTMSNINNTITWSLNDTIICTYSNTSGYTNGAIMVGYGDLNTSTGSTNDFAVFDNIRVELPNSASVSVTNTAPSIPEDNSSSASFLFTRTGDTTAPFTLNYVVSGTATSGTDYTALPGSVTFPAFQSTVAVPLTAIDDSIAELTESVIVTIVPPGLYAVGVASSTINILDNEPSAVAISVAQPSMYERLPGDYITYRLIRTTGATNTDISVNINYSGTAVLGTDYSSAPANVSIPNGVTNVTFQAASPIDNTNVAVNKTVIATIGAGSGYTIGTASATGTIIDDDLAAESPILFKDSLTNDTSANWKVLFGANNNIDDKSIQFAYPPSNDNGIPAPPNGVDSVLKVTVNKGEGSLNGAAGVNLYPIGQSFSGDYAVRFNMYLLQGSLTNSATEFASFGINESGNSTNWYKGSTNAILSSVTNFLPFGVDGLYYSVGADGSGSAPGDFGLLTGTNTATNAPTIIKTTTSASQVNIFKKLPFNGNLAGAPSANAFDFPPGSTWVDVEVKQVGGVVTMSIDKTALIVYTNLTPYTSGNLMLGYMDPYDSVGQVGSVYYSNLRVIGLPITAPTITKVSGTTNVITLRYTGSTNDTSVAFHVQSSSTVNGPYTNDTTATNSAVSAGVFQTTLPVNGTNRFYRIIR